jgi:hypothetical protein
MKLGNNFFIVSESKAQLEVQDGTVLDVMVSVG